MNKTRKIELLYQRAHGQGGNISSEELKELRQYKVSSSDGNYATKANIREYVGAVDGGYRLSFYDWCQNNLKADRRRKGSSEREMAQDNRMQGIGAILLGWLEWGIAIYWMFHGAIPVNSCAVAGAIISIILLRLNRRWAGFTLFLLPIILAAIFNKIL